MRLLLLQLEAVVEADGSTLQLLVPPTRSDILHACDVAEDVSIAYGYNNIPTRVGGRAGGGGGRAGGWWPGAWLGGRPLVPARYKLVRVHMTCGEGWGVV